MQSVSPIIPVIFIVLTLAFIAWILSGIWVYRDAGYRTSSPVLFLIAVLLVCWPVSLLAWLIVRPREKRYRRGERKM